MLYIFWAGLGYRSSLRQTKIEAEQDKKFNEIIFYLILISAFIHIVFAIHRASSGHTWPEIKNFLYLPGMVFSFLTASKISFTFFKKRIVAYMMISFVTLYLLHIFIKVNDKIYVIENEKPEYRIHLDHTIYSDVHIVLVSSEYIFIANESSEIDVLPKRRISKIDKIQSVEKQVE